jgi:hypothetical protein
VKYLPTYGKWVGVSLCSASRYKIFLGDDPQGVFYEIGDYAGHGQDHCELVNPSFRIPNEDDITSGGCSSCSIDSAHVFQPPVGSQGWSRARFGDPFRFESSWPQYNLYTAQWYECGVDILPAASTTTSTTSTTSTTLAGSTIQIESFDSAAGWTRSGNSTSTITVDAVDRQEGGGSLVWSSTINEQITKTFASPKDLSSVAELRIWFRGNRTIGSACCAFSMQLLSGSGYFQRGILPDIPPNVWREDISERDSWTPSPFGSPSWANIRGVSFIFYGDSSTTTIHMDDLRMVTVSSTAPTVRRSAGAVVNDSIGPLSGAVAWSNPGNGTVADGAYAFVTLPDNGQFGFTGSRYLNASGFGFAIPSGAVIRGIRVEVRQHRDPFGFVVWDDAIILRKNGVRTGLDRAFGDDFTIADAYRYYGGPTDLWGTSWTPSDINAVGFGASIAVATHSPPETAYVDDIRIGVYYDVP